MPNRGRNAFESVSQSSSPRVSPGGPHRSVLKPLDSYSFLCPPQRSFRSRLRMSQERCMSVVAFVQGSYFLITGIWSSLIHIDSFQRVTGRKTDLWLVKTVGILVSAIGAGLILAGVTQQLPELEEMPTQVYKSMSLMVNQPMQHAIIKLPKKRTWMVKTPTIEPAYAREERVPRLSSFHRLKWMRCTTG